MVKKTVYVSIVGGFGNNLHQIAFSKKIESMGYQVKFDISSKKRAQIEIIEIPELRNFFERRVAGWTRFIPSPTGNRRRLSAILIKYIQGLKLHIDLSSNGHEPENLKGGYFLTGYLQNIENAKYLGNVNFFKKNELKGAIGIHVRRGDMISNIDNPLDSFFRKSLQIIDQKNQGKKLEILIFTDDAEYCSKFLKLGRDFTLIQGGNTLDDFLSMISTEYLILSRSTFSWWAGFLSKGEIYCPSPWDLDQKVRDSSIIPPYWIKVPVDNF